MDKLNVIVPVFNEEGQILKLVNELPRMLAFIPPTHWSFIFIDNGSTDNSKKEISKIISSGFSATLIELDKPNYGAAIRAGILSACNSHCLIINVDFFDGAFIKWSWENRASFDFIVGSKRADLKINQQATYRKFLSWGLNFLLRNLFGSPLSDTHGIKFFNTNSIVQLANKTILNRGQFDTELSLRALDKRLKIAEIPVPIVEIRPPRNFMAQKIVRNLVDISKLYRIVKTENLNCNQKISTYTREQIIDSLTRS